MTSQEGEPSEMQARLTTWLEKKIPEAGNLAISDIQKPGMGLSSQTYLFDVNWEESGQQKTKGVVLRAAPPEFKVFPEYELGHQFRIMDALKDTKVPVATMLWLEEDASVIGAPFFLMERLDGEVPQDFPSYHGSGMFFEATPAERAKMWWGSLEAMVELHKIGWKTLGVDFLGTPGDGTDPMDRQLAYWERFFDWMRDDPQEAHPTIEASMTWLKENRYAPDRVALCWGDARMGNTLYSKPERDVLAIMDWEMAYIGDPESDLAWFIMLDRQHSVGAGLPRCEGTPTPEETVARYEELTGWRVKNLFYNEVLGATGYAMILVSVFRKFRQQGIPIGEDMILNNFCTQRLSELLDLPSPGPVKTETANLDEVIVSIQFHFTGPGGCDWHLISDKGRGSRHDGVVQNPTCTVTVSADDWKAIQSGDLNRLDAWSTGRLVVDGDLNVMMQLEDMIAEFNQ
jgi:aminoglycoside phosphotransferase (APT) family kinase protein/putative sterol carrier protein